MVHSGPITSESPGPGQSKPKDVDRVDKPTAARAATPAQPSPALQPTRVAPEDQPKARTDLKQGFAPVEPNPARVEDSRVPARVPPVGAEGASSSGQTQGGEGHAPAPNQPLRARRPRAIFGIGAETLNTAEAQQARREFDLHPAEQVVAKDATVTIKK